MTRITARWIDAPASRAVMAALGVGYFVGGCVRNSLLGAPVSDIDVATPLTPDDVIGRLEANGLKAVPTGLKHGTVTAVHEGTPIEVTTFRTDVATDGRHAEVVFTTDIATDASRRDFTMNALYADAEGVLIDPLGGLQDVEARRLRFIGVPEDRIREDYLRILRFFRFHAWYGEGGIDADGLSACAALADGLTRIARERVGWELRKLLAAPDPAPAVASMAVSGVLLHSLPGAEPSVLAPLVHFEEEAGIAADWRTRLAALGGGDRADALKLSRDETQHLAAITAALGLPDLAEAAYRHGETATTAATLIRSASLNAPLPTDWRTQISAGSTARFPLKAGDLLATGWQQGPALGATLAKAEAAWIASGFEATREELLASAQA